MSTANLSFTDAESRSNDLHIDSYRLHLNVEGAQSEATFPVQVDIAMRSQSGAIFLDYVGHSVERVLVDGDSVPFHFDGARITLTVPADQDIVLSIAANSSYSRTGQGLHRFTDPADNRTYLYSHLEPSDARRIFPCFDQPDLKAHFHTSLTVPQGWVALSNQPEISRNGQRHDFDETPLLSTYLTAFAAGEYISRHRTWTSPTGQQVELGVWARTSMAEFVDDEILTITSQGLDFFDAHFGYPYPWGKYDSIFVPEYNLGAMENPGLVTFTEAYIFRDPATYAEHAARTNTILHEMSHMWFGDLVTPRWWDDLWLKESFAEFMGADASVSATAYTSAWADFAGQRKNWAYAQDQLPTTHPIKATIPDVDAARQNFDGITYAKGAAVLKQLVHYVGRDNFYAAARDYFHTYAFGTATFDDLIVILGRHSDRDLSDWAQRWLHSAGPDTLSPVLETNQGLITSLAIEQQGTDVTRPHRLTVSLFKLREQAIERTKSFDVIVDQRSGGLTPIDVAVGLETPDLILINDGDHSYAKVTFDQRSVNTIAQALSTISDEITRAVIWTSLWNMTRDALLDPRIFIKIALAHAAAEENPALMRQIFAHALFAARHYLADDEDLRIALATGLKAQADRARDGSDAQRVLLQAFVQAAPLAGHERAAELSAILTGPLTLGNKLEWDIITALTALGEDTAELRAAQLERDNTLTGRAHFLRAEKSVPSLKTKDELFAMLVNPREFSNDEVRALVDAYNQPLSGVDHTERFFAALTTIWELNPIEIATVIIRGLYPEQPHAHAQVDAYIRAGIPRALERILLECQDNNLRAQRARDSFTVTPS
ncbi:aminopeptidase N [Corynebacterium sp. ES2794-CONJ1]|uniref:aminopeptidase N n=1 Tax=Corynebacterium sp. ES2794-CONJ1 TaxID=2980553 RepID=UPI0021DAB6BC|nr:aminopeptidase N [Corynebacterium sp. ES2794-CONJ1]MCU9519552.1 aminopeptidase N [Corynebacterium sp. ES2794-CONJ1]